MTAPMFTTAHLAELGLRARTAVLAARLDRIPGPGDLGPSTRRHTYRPAAPSPKAPPTSGNAKSVIEAIHADPALPWTVENFAKGTGQNRIAFARMFSRHTGRFHPPMIGAGGLNPRRYLIAVRMELAKRLLLTTDLPFDDIALRVGYQGANAFADRFRLEVGMNASTFRERVRR